ncbi:MAG: T9SS type A sorting domain-containing protein [Bacteroidota bacterium]
MKRCLLYLLFVLCTGILFAQPGRKAVVLNMNTRNAETNNSRFLSVVRMLRMAGVPFDTTSQLNTAFNYPVIITGSRILDTVFTASEQTQLYNYVFNGGVLVASSMRDSTLYNLFGISADSSSNQLYRVTWDTLTQPGYFSMINDSMEVTVSLGDTSQGSTFFTRFYTLNGAESLGNYENGNCALSHFSYGNGHSYAFGPDFRDVSLRNQLDLDLEAQRVYSNGFEPTGDVFVFILRNIIRKHIPFSASKYTSPYNTKNVVLVTHDMDSKTGIDTMQAFADYETSKNISAQYNLTTRYISDGWMTGFYVGSWSKVHYLLSGGHVLASHSVGHFPDFDDESVFPYGNLGNTPGTYQPFYTGGITTGGTVLGELEVSKNLIEDDHTVSVRSFRAGHLCYPDSLVLGLMQTGYEFNSTLSAGNILTGFPFYDLDTRSFSGNESTILEIPMMISDVFSTSPMDETNYLQKAQLWTNVTRQYADNHSPVTLLIHPNRMYKLSALQAYADSVENESAFYAFEEYGDFWHKRDSLEFHTELNSDTLSVIMDNALLVSEQSFMIDFTGLDTVLFFDNNGSPLAFNWQDEGNGQRLYYQSPSMGWNEWVNENEIPLLIYPNPAQNGFTIETGKKLYDGKVEIFNLTGSLVLSFPTEGKSEFWVDSRSGFPAGIYLVRIGNEVFHGLQRLIIVK